MGLLFRLLGVQVDTLSRQEAALAVIDREVTFLWRPVVVELAQESTLAPPPAPLGEVSSD